MQGRDRRYIRYLPTIYFGIEVNVVEGRNIRDVWAEMNYRLIVQKRLVPMRTAPADGSDGWIYPFRGCVRNTSVYEDIFNCLEVSGVNQGPRIARDILQLGRNHKLREGVDTTLVENNALMFRNVGFVQVSKLVPAKKVDSPTDLSHMEGRISGKGWKTTAHAQGFRVDASWAPFLLLDCWKRTQEAESGPSKHI